MSLTMRNAHFYFLLLLYMCRTVCVHVSCKTHFNKDTFYSRRFGSILCFALSVSLRFCSGLLSSVGNVLHQHTISFGRFFTVKFRDVYSIPNVSMSLCLFVFVICVLCDILCVCLVFIYFGLKHHENPFKFTMHNVKLRFTQASDANAFYLFIHINIYIWIIVKVLERDNSLCTLSLNKSQWFENLQLFFRCDSHFRAFYAVQMSMM